MRSIKDYPHSPTYAGSRGYTATRYVKQNAFNTLRDIDAAKGKKKIKIRAPDSSFTPSAGLLDYFSFQANNNNNNN